MASVENVWFAMAGFNTAVFPSMLPWKLSINALFISDRALPHSAIDSDLKKKSGTFNCIIKLFTLLLK